MILKNTILLFVLLFILKSVSSAKILVVTQAISESHQKIYYKVAEELTKKGHEVHYVTPIPPKNVSYKVYGLGDMYINNSHQANVTVMKLHQYFMMKQSFTSMFFRQKIVHFGLHSLAEQSFRHRQVQRLLKTHKKFDVCIVEWFYPTLAVFGHLFQCPLIGISSTGMLLPALDAVGNPSHPVLAPDQDLPLSRDMTFFERVWSGIWAVYVRIFYQLVTLPEEDKTIKKYFGDDLPSLNDMVANISLLLVNTNIIFHRNVPNLPTVVQFGGRRKHELPLQPLNKDLEQFIINAPNGVVYFSLGSGVQPETLKPHIVKTFQDAFASLPFDFIWKWNGTMPNKPKNVLTKPWLPQEAVLGHPNVKLFIYQGGLQSSEETISAHKPVIGIPFHSDQTFNIDTCVRYGMGETIALEDLTVDKLKSLILKVVNNQSYAKNAERLDLLIKDQPMDGLDKAVWWIEYVIRHKGAHHLRSPAAIMPLWQYLMLDVIAFLLAIVFVSYMLIKFISKKAFRLIMCSRKKSKTD